MWWLYLFLIFIGYLIYRGLSNKDSPQVEDNQFRHRKTGRRTSYSQDREKESLIQSAKRQENMNNYDEASRLYLRAGQVFSAAKMKAMKGPQHANQAVEMIQINSPERAELITRNLANDFFYRLEQPATSAALLRSLGMEDEAEAVEVAAGISAPQIHSETVQSRSTTTMEAPSAVEFEQMEEESMETSEPVISESVEKKKPKIDGEKEKESKPARDTFPNSMMMASSTLEESCSVCKRAIKSGDSFIYCLNCGKPGHYQHLGEMIKVTGKCPICKKRLAPTMYDV